MRKIDLEEQHKILLEMAKAFHEICQKHSIPYYMLGGTMLGAVRHGGFIPWDDDMDFGIPRERFDEFCACAKKELTSPLRLLDQNNSDYAILGIVKLNNDNTVFPEIWSIATDESLGINIDIFPLDYTDKRTGIFSVNWYVRTLFKVQKLLFVDTTNRPWHKKILAYIAKTLIHIKKNTLPNYLHKFMLKTSCKPEMVANLYGAWAMKEVVPVEIFGKPKPYNFEDTFFFGVENAEAYLTHLYKDYMQLPPEDKRHIHATDIYVIS